MEGASWRNVDFAGVRARCGGRGRGDGDTVWGGGHGFVEEGLAGLTFDYP